jgi:hypothetical protein
MVEVEIVEITWTHVLKIWWACFWRAMLGAVVTGFLAVVTGFLVRILESSPWLHWLHWLHFNADTKGGGTLLMYSLIYSSGGCSACGWR